MSGVRGHAITERISLISETCCNCGVLFAMGSEFRALRLEDHRNFYCPAGHSMAYTGETREQRERERAEQAERELADARTRLIQERDKVRQVQRRLATERRRTAAAVCPCCNRSFVQLRRHLTAKHPDYTASALAGESS